MSMFIPSSAWRQERAACAILRACDLLRTSLTPEQEGAVHQILFESSRLFLEARASLGPLAQPAFYAHERTPLHDQEMTNYAEQAKGLSKQLLRAPQDCVTILGGMMK